MKHVYYIEYEQYGSGWSCGVDYDYRTVVAENTDEAIVKANIRTPRPENVRPVDLGTVEQFNQMMFDSRKPDEIMDSSDTIPLYFKAHGIKNVITEQYDRWKK
jgi:hypothetical protein